MSIVEGFALEPMVGDPDDDRPGSSWALVADPGGPAGRVDDLALIVERIGPGERIPAHVHKVDEVILPQAPGWFRLGDDVQPVDEGAVIFIPAGAVHGLENRGASPLPIRAIFPTTSVWIRYVQRNPAPGTENDPPSPSVTVDLRTGAVTSDREG